MPDPIRCEHCLVQSAILEGPEDFRFTGNDNYGKPRKLYLEKLRGLTDEKLVEEIGSVIYMSALCHNNPRADWHWQADAGYEECKQRGKVHLYDRAYEAARRSTCDY